MTVATALEPLFDRTIIDPDQSDLFQQIGRQRSPFRGVERWPHLDDEFARHSATLLESGHEEWVQAGGERDAYGLTLRPDSQAAEEVIRQLEADPGGFITDVNGNVIAVRLLRSRKQGRRFGLCFQFDAASSTNLPGVPDEEDVVHVPKIRLAGRAEQLLWRIHAEVMRHRQSMITLPVDLVSQLFWGSNSKPANWRRDLERTFRSLTNLRIEILNLNRRGWQPQLGSTSVLVDHVEFSWNLRDLSCSCDSTCALWGSNTRHDHHVRVGIGHAFLGVLEKCSIGAEQGSRLYDFKLSADLKSKTEPVVPAVQSLICKKDLGLSHDDQGVLRALLSEVTGKPDLQIGNVTPGVSQPCPYLAADGSYFSFNGNGRWSGRGYRIRGKRNTGWLFKAGLTASQESPLEQTRRLLASLERLADRLGIVAVAYAKSSQRWCSLNELRSLAGCQQHWATLDSLILRVYGPADFHRRLTEMSQSPAEPVIQSASQTDLNERLRASGFTQGQIAREIGVSRQFVNKLLQGVAAWPEEKAMRAAGVLAARERT